MYGGDSCSMGFKIWELYLKINLRLIMETWRLSSLAHVTIKKLSYDILAKHYNVK